MRVLPGIPVTDAILTSSTVAENDHAAWSSGTTYAAGARVILASTHRIYESVQASNTNHDPTTDDGTWWADMGPTNRWKMFDVERSTGTTSATAITVVLTPGERFDSIALTGLIGTSVTIAVTVGGDPIYSHTETLSARVVTSWYEYLVTPFSYKSVVARFDIPPVTGAVLTLTVEPRDGAASIGGLLFGRSVYIGATQYDAVSDVLNFSTVSRDAFGIATLTKRRNVPKTTSRVLIPSAKIAQALLLREELNATPAFWSGVDDAANAYFEPLQVLGFYRQFAINAKYPSHAEATIELEEV